MLGTCDSFGGSLASFVLGRGPGCAASQRANAPTTFSSRCCRLGASLRALFSSVSLRCTGPASAWPLLAPSLHVDPHCDDAL